MTWTAFDKQIRDARDVVRRGTGGTGGVDSTMSIYHDATVGDLASTMPRPCTCLSPERGDVILVLEMFVFFSFFFMDKKSKKRWRGVFTGVADCPLITW